MNRAELFLHRAVEADERAAESATAEAKKTWTNIAAEYRLYAKMAAHNERRLVPVPFIFLYFIGATMIGIGFILLMRAS